MVEVLQYSFGKEKRLLRNSEFQRVYAEGQKKIHAYFTLHWLRASNDESTRVGFAVGRKVANAVLRNKIKRRLREIIRTYPQPIVPAHWVVVSAKRNCACVDFSALKETVYLAIKESLK